MNCLTCESGLNFYQKSKNCLKCPTFVNFNQTDCLSVIPKGYYIEDRQLGTIGKCYNLCETCDKGPSKTNNNIISMNCKTCLYENKSLKLSDGECPAAPGKRKGDEKKEDEIEVDEPQKITLLVFTIITCAVLAVLIIGVIIFLTCYNMRANKRKENNNDYFNIGGKDIPFEDENNSNINKRNRNRNYNNNDNDNDNNNFAIN